MSNECETKMKVDQLRQFLTLNLSDALGGCPELAVAIGCCPSEHGDVLIFKALDAADTLGRCSRNIRESAEMAKRLGESE